LFSGKHGVLFLTEWCLGYFLFAVVGFFLLALEFHKTVVNKLELK